MMWVIRLSMVMALSVLAGFANAQSAPQRVALVIANAAYTNAGILTNPPNDARVVGEALRRAGFQTVTTQRDLTKQGFERALRDFRDRASGAQVALVYYAGHGIEGNGRNWLLPIDAKLSVEGDLVYEAINLELVLDTVAGADLRVVILDACRDNPFGRTWRRGTRSVARGLSGVDADDVLVIYAAAPGQTAADGTGANSPFATALAQRLPEPDLPVQLLGGKVRDDVLRATGGQQRPFVSASVTGTPFYFVRRAPSVAAPQPAPDPAAVELAVWNGALSANTAPAFEDYLRQYPQGRFRVQAQQNLDRLRVSANAQRPATPPPQSNAAPSVATLTPGQTFRDCADCPEMVVIPAGSFVMGSPTYEAGRGDDEGPQTMVSIRAFAAGRFEVTFDEWSTCVAGGGCRSNSNPSDAGWGRGKRPVINVSWNDAQEYLQWLYGKTGKRYRFLTEAEWEYAARGKSNGGTNELSVWWGAKASRTFANYGAEGCCSGAVSGADQWVNTAPVGSFPANLFGLFDMHGNVWEWVEDCYRDSLSGQTAAAYSASSCISRVIRGGSWGDDPQILRSANRNVYLPEFRSGIVGFRIARTL